MGRYRKDFPIFASLLPLFSVLFEPQNHPATSRPPSLRNGLFPDAYAAGLGILGEKGAKFNPCLVLSQKVPSEEEQNVALGLGSRGCGVIAGPADATQRAAIWVVEVIHVTGAPLLHFQRWSKRGLEKFSEIRILGAQGVPNFTRSPYSAPRSSTGARTGKSLPSVTIREG